jgi:3-isopropylmalate dehydratase small subunit
MSKLAERVRGKVWKFGDSVDTNQMAGGGLQGKDAEDTLRINCLRGLRPEFPEQVRPGDIVVAGKNFGNGSSRQTAVQALQLNGVAAVLAESVARIHRRNSIALALPTFVVPGITELVNDGDELEIDYAASIVRNLSNSKTIALSKLPPTVEQIYEHGGIFQVIAKKLADRGIVPSSQPT